MLTLEGPATRFCDGISRRSFLRIGGLAMGGIGLPELLASEAAAGTRSGHRSVIMVYLSGGLAHQDTFDLKMNAPAEVRGEFRPISTKIPGIEFGELLPQLAMSADKLAVIRSIVGLRDEHSSWQNTTGYPMVVAQREGKPHFGSVIARAQGPVDPVVPPFVDLFPVMQHKPYNSPTSGHLGNRYAAAKMDAESLALLRPTDLTSERIEDRRRMLETFDQWRHEVETQPVEGMGNVYRQAFETLSSSRVAKALDLSKEDPRLRDRYGIGSDRHLGDGAPMWNDQLLIARRLVEAGVRCVTVAYGFWDTHGNNFNHLKQHLPLFDRGISALIEDLHQRGLDRDVTVVVWGEFGRTPKINKEAGRDHWAPVNSCLLAGGGMKVGTVIGSTDKLGAYANATPIHYLDVLATIYRNLGIDPHSFLEDQSGRPIPILPGTARPIEALI
ncbi:MAG: DUF1501 domain-containing protein [Isosphaeraceae bacterium]|nr:DUF1501 domain-containing protein [Isosphaeraceae bacterium]